MNQQLSFTLRLGAVAMAVLAASARPSAAATCDSLTKALLPDVRVDSAQDVAPGGFAPPAAAGQTAAPNPFANLPSFCRVSATVRPSSEAPIRIEVWLPASGWNGRLRAIGNDGFYNAAPIGVAALAGALRAGYATVASDGGRQGDSSYILRSTEQLTNFAYRATHEMIVAAKTLAAAFYGTPPTLSAAAECGGRGSIGLSSVQRYPADLDAVAVGEFIGDSTRHMANQWWVWQAVHQDAASTIPAEKYPMIQRAAVGACDTIGDGIKDGIIGDPTKCTFDPGVIQCKAGDAPDCLTAPQVTALRKIYAGATNPRTKARVAPPLMRGSETYWTPLVQPDPNPVSIAFFKYFALRDPDWDYKSRPLDFDADIARADAQTAALPINATNPDIKAFVARGGKLMLYAGWGDPFVPPGISVDYYDKVVDTIGRKAAQQSVRLFMVPGMRNCPGTAGAEAFNFDPMAVIQQWRESGTAPDAIIAPHFQNGTEVGTRLLCAYPKVAMYKGSGDPHEARNFSCRTP
jgi:feruloyl esterase